MIDKFRNFIDSHQSFVIIQAENPDGDSLGSALGLEAILTDQGKKVSLYCPVDIPKYMRYVSGWDRVTQDFDFSAEATIIVDTSSQTLLSKLLEIPTIQNFLEHHPALAIDHHASVTSDLPFTHEMIMADKAVATGEAIANLAQELSWEIKADAATALSIAILSDSLGLTTEGTTAGSIHTLASLVEAGARLNEIELARRAYMKKSAEILQYKGKLIERIEYLLEDKLALVHIPWEEIEAYSDQYNPSVLVLDEMRLVENVEVAIAIKTYPDGKLTGKLRTNAPVADKIAGYFGGGGHPYAAGFRIYESYEKMLPELVNAAQKALEL